MQVMKLRWKYSIFLIHEKFSLFPTEIKMTKFSGGIISALVFYLPPSELEFENVEIWSK